MAKARSLLLIHEEGPLQKLLKNYIHSELEDLELIEAFTYEDALKTLKKSPLEVILCGRLPGRSPQALYRKVQEISKNRQTPFIIVNASQTKSDVEALAKPGSQHSLIFPFTAEELSTKINLVSASESRRVFERVYLLNAQVQLHGPSLDLDAGILNMSVGGMLCDYSYDSSYVYVPEVDRVSLTFNKGASEVALENIPCHFLHMHVLSWYDDNRPKYVRSAWRFTDLEPEQEELLKQVFQENKEQLEKLSKLSHP